nr:phytanoyl-CoA dioxygenase family protein [Mesorhizobium sp.]
MDADGVIDPEVAERFSWEPVVWNASDIFIFDDYAPHYSQPNKSNCSRRTLYLVFQRASTGGPTRAEYNVLKRALSPPEGKVADLDKLKPPNRIFLPRLSSRSQARHVHETDRPLKKCAESVAF